LRGKIDSRLRHISANSIRCHASCTAFINSLQNDFRHRSASILRVLPRPLTFTQKPREPPAGGAEQQGSIDFVAHAISIAGACEGIAIRTFIPPPSMPGGCRSAGGTGCQIESRRWETLKIRIAKRRGSCLYS
jgi:hypothetical protein